MGKRREVTINVRQPRGMVDSDCRTCKKQLNARDWRHGKTRLAFVHVHEAGKWVSTHIFHADCVPDDLAKEGGLR